MSKALVPIPGPSGISGTSGRWGPVGIIGNCRGGRHCLGHPSGSGAINVLPDATIGGRYVAAYVDLNVAIFP